MEGQQMAGASSQASPVAIGLSGPTCLSHLMSSVASETQSSGLNLLDIPLSLSAFNGYQPNITLTASDDLLVSSINLPLNGLPDASLYKMSDSNFLNTVDALSKGDAKSPLNIIVASDGIQMQGQSSPAISSQMSMSSGHQFQSVVSGGDKMLSAVNSLNFNDPELLGDSAFDSTSSTGLPQFDDGLLSTLGPAGQGMRLGDGPSGTSFDLFDGGVADSLSLSPQPFPDANLMSDTAGSVLDTGLLHHQTDSILDNTAKTSDKKNSATLSQTTDLSSQKFGSSQCPVCSKTFSNIGALAKHRLTHSDERKYVCNVCSKGFKRQDHLNGHLMTHLDKKPYECQLPNCDKGYCDARSLRRHLEQHHHLDPETIQTHVQASMAAAGISPPAPRNGSKKATEGRGKPLSSPVCSPGSATPTPSPGAAGAGNVFHFDAQQLKNSQQQKQQELLVQQIHQQQKLLLQQQKQQKQQQEEKAKEQKATLQASDAVSKQLQLQLQLQQQQKQPQQQQQPADMLAVIQQVQQLQQQMQQQQQLDVQKKKAAAIKDSAAQQDLSWQDKAGVYTFVGTPTSSEPSPASRSDQSPSNIVVSGDLQSRSPVSPATSQPISPLTNPASRTAWYNNSPDTAMVSKTDEMPKNQAYCATCDRYFKNAAALNGHMRCHGGFLKKGKDKDGKKSPVRKSSASSASEMGPPLRRPPHTSTPSPQPAISRTSPTTPNSITYSPLAPHTPGQSSTDQHSAIDVLSVGSPTNPHMQSFAVKAEVASLDSVLPQQKHKQLQEQLSSHILKRRMSGEQQQQQQQQRRQQKTLQQQPVHQQQQQHQIQSNQEQMRLLEEHIKAQQQQQQLQEQSQHNIQLLAGQLLGDASTVPMQLDTGPARTASPHQGEHIQRLVQSFQQVEELQRQQQQQGELPQLSAEQLEQIRQQHKLLGLPPLNPQQLQYQLQEEQNQLLQAQIREQQLQEQQQQQLQEQHQQQQLQGLDQGSLVMTSSSLTHQALLQQLGTTQITSAPVSSQSLGLPVHQSLVQLNSQPADTVDSTASISSQMALNTSVQQILAALDPAVVSAAGINLADHQQLLAQLQKQQQMQQDAVGMQVHSPSTGMSMAGQPTALVSGQMSGLHMGQIPQILLQPPDSDDMNGVPTISIPESVVLGSDPSSVLQTNSLETEAEQIERIQNGLMASVEKQQQESIAAAFNQAGMAHTLTAGQMGDGRADSGSLPNFLDIQAPSNQLQSVLVSQPSYGHLRESTGPGSSSNISSSNSIQQDPCSFLNVISSSSSTSSSSSLTAPSTSSAIARNTDAAVAQILKNISNSMAESSGMVVPTDHSDVSSSRAVIGGPSLDSTVDRAPSYQSFQSFSSSFSKPFKDSIKQDVMLSSTMDSDSNNLSTFPNDPLSKDDVPFEPKPTTVQQNGQNNKRRLSADLETHRRSSSFSSFNKSHSLGMNPHSMLVNPLEVEGLSSGRTRVRSKSGDVNYKYIRSKSVDHSPMHSRSFTEDSLYRSNRRLEETFIKGGRLHHHQDQDLFTRSDGAGVFRNPSTLPSPLKIKRKHRPAPLYIPPQFGIFQSRLRSPRVINKDGHLSAERGRGHTPPPYTPPPMLSPYRSGSGLFCTLQSVHPLTPRSAPVSGKVLLNRRGSTTTGSGKSEGNFSAFTDQTAEEEAAPETDTEAHINVGPEYQAMLPELRDKNRARMFTPVDNRNSLLWDPSSAGDNTDNQLQCYQEFSCSAAVKGNGCNVEYALHLLQLAKGNISEAMLMLMADPPELPVGHPMLDYKYQESDAWNSNEMERFYKSIMVHDKDFFKVAKEVGTKSVKQCIQFYYVWKKVCPDDYKRLRQARNKQGDYNTRRQAERAAAQAAAEKAAQVVMNESQQAQNQNIGNTATPMDGVEENLESVDSDNASSLLSDNDDTNMAPDSVNSTAPNTANSTPTRGESPTPLPPPQFHCTYEGCTATCSSKQSLKRHMRKHQEKAQSSPSAPRKPRPSTPSRSPVYDEFGEEIFPCRLCGRIFAKVKSRSAHMKSHKIAEQAQQEKKAAELAAAAAAAANSSYGNT